MHLYRDIWAAALEQGLPAMCVGTGWDVWEEYGRPFPEVCIGNDAADTYSRNPGADKSPDFVRIREMDATFDKIPFPQDDYTSFSSTCIYWKRQDAGAATPEQDVLEDLQRLRVS